MNIPSSEAEQSNVFFSLTFPVDTWSDDECLGIPKMAERMVAPQVPDLPVYRLIRRLNPELAAGMFGHHYYFVLMLYNQVHCIHRLILGNLSF